MITLVFDEQISGHHLEYLHHYYLGAVERKKERFVFYVNPFFWNEKDKYVWEDSENVTFRTLTEEEVTSVQIIHGLTDRWKLAKLIARKALEVQADRVILTNFIHTIPLLLFTMPKGIFVRGIIYRIFLYEKHRVSKLRYMTEWFCFWLMSISRVMEKIFILNDEESAATLNSMFHTQKFTYLPDPVPLVNRDTLVNLRHEYGIPSSNKVFLHFGGLARRKGTLEILKAIRLLTNEQSHKMTFIFAGEVYCEIKEEFYKLVAENNQKAQLLVFDEFCSYEFLFNLCHTCDVILMPYKQTNLSSGVLGYAAVFGKPVIGPSKGLLGHLIDKYDMGTALADVKATDIVSALTNPTVCNSSEYALHNEVEKFIDRILD